MQKSSFDEPPRKSSDTEWERRWDNLRVAALCIGVRAYPADDALHTTVKDTKKICREINKLN